MSQQDIDVEAVERIASTRNVQKYLKLIKKFSTKCTCLLFLHLILPHLHYIDDMNEV